MHKIVLAPKDSCEFSADSGAGVLDSQDLTNILIGLPRLEVSLKSAKGRKSKGKNINSVYRLASQQIGES